MIKSGVLIPKTRKLPVQRIWWSKVVILAVIHKLLLQVPIKTRVVLVLPKRKIDSLKFEWKHLRNYVWIQTTHMILQPGHLKNMPIQRRTRVSNILNHQNCIVYLKTSVINLNNQIIKPQKILTKLFLWRMKR